MMSPGFTSSITSGVWPKSFPLAITVSAARRACYLHAAICEHKMRCVVSLRGDVNLFLFVRPAVQMRDQFVRTRRQVQAERRAPSQLSIDENLSAAGFAGDVCEAP